MTNIKQCMHTGLVLIKNTDLLLGLPSETGISRGLRCSVYQKSDISDIINTGCLTLTV